MDGARRARRHGVVVEPPLRARSAHPGAARVVEHRTRRALRPQHECPGRDGRPKRASSEASARSCLAVTRDGFSRAAPRLSVPPSRMGWEWTTSRAPGCAPSWPSVVGSDSGRLPLTRRLYLLGTVEAVGVATPISVRVDGAGTTSSGLVDASAGIALLGSIF